MTSYSCICNLKKQNELSAYVIVIVYIQLPYLSLRLAHVFFEELQCY